MGEEGGEPCIVLLPTMPSAGPGFVPKSDSSSTSELVMPQTWRRGGRRQGPCDVLSDKKHVPRHLGEPMWDEE